MCSLLEWLCPKLKTTSSHYLTIKFFFYCVMLMCETFVYIRLKLAFWSSRCPWSCIVTFHNAKPPRHDQTNIKIVKCCTKRAIFEPRRPVGCNHLLKYLLHSDLSTSVYTQPKMQVHIMYPPPHIVITTPPPRKIWLSIDSEVRSCSQLQNFQAKLSKRLA